jgi:D-alanyl-D-alanine carboxypeptidase
MTRTDTLSCQSPATRQVPPTTPGGPPGSPGRSPRRGTGGSTRRGRRWNRIALGCLPFVMLALVMAPSSADSGRADRHPDRGLQDALNAVVSSGVSGLEVRIDNGSRMWTRASGAAVLAAQVPWRPGETFRAGSVTKTFVATVALQLVDSGRLRLRDPVDRWLPGVVPNGKHITLRQLLQQTSGLYDFIYDEQLASEYTADPSRSYSPREVVAFGLSHPPLFPPGTSWAYSNTNYVLTGMILERVTGHTVGSLLRSRIIRPLHLRHTFLATSGVIPVEHAHGYLPISGPERFLDVTDWNPTWAGASGALVSTTNDLRRFYQALLSGHLLRHRTLAKMESTVASPAVPGSAYGMGLFSMDTPCGRVWGHTGDIFGYSTMAFSNRRGTRSVVIAAGTPTDATDEIAAATKQLFDVATCRMFKRHMPAPHAARTPMSRPLVRQ